MKKMTTIRGKEDDNKKAMPTWQKIAIGALVGVTVGGVVYFVWKGRVRKVTKAAKAAEALVEHADDVKTIADTAEVAAEAVETTTDILKATGSPEDAVNICGLIHEFVVDNDFFMDFVNAGGRITWESIPTVGEEAACIGESAVAVAQAVEATTDLADVASKAVQMGVF
jgi:hypothetical protein